MELFCKFKETFVEFQFNSPMELHIINPHQAFLNLQPGLPDNFRGQLLAGSQPYSASGSMGSFIIQKTASDHYSLCYRIFRLLKRVTLQSICHQPGLHTRIVLQGKVIHRIKGLTRIGLQDGQFAILYVNRAECLSDYNKGEEYHIMDIYFSREMLQPFLPRFPQLAILIANVDTPVIQLTPPRAKAGQQVMLILTGLLQAPYEKSTGRFFVDDRVPDLLGLLLETVFEQPPSTVQFSDEEIRALERVKTYIEEHYLEHYTIMQLSRQAEMNEYKLKAGFRQQFKMSLFECLMEVRMKKAMELIIAGELSIKEITFKVGYKRLSSFVNAFRKYYGQPPGHMRHHK